MLIVLALLCRNFYLFAQPNVPTAALKPGAKIPDLLFSELINYPPKSIQVSSFKGKLLILDFWATWCSSCLSYFPKTERLQKQFKGKLQILGVTNQSQAKIQAFFNSPSGKRYHFPTVVNDTQLEKLFPHQYLPHYVWIAPDGTFLLSTSGAIIDSAAIARYLEQGILPGKAKNDLDTKLPLFLTTQYPADNQLQYYSVLSKGHYYGLPTGNKFRRTKKVLHGRAVTNSTLFTIYKAAAFGLFEKIGESLIEKRILLEVRDLHALKGDKVKVTEHDHDYNFDIVLPVEQADSLFHSMLRTLNQYSPYEGRVETREVECLALVRSGEGADFATKGGKVHTFQPEKDSSLVNNLLISDFLAKANTIPGIKPYLIDSTGYTGKVDFRLNGPIRDLEKLRANLRPYGLDLVPAKRALKVFTLRDKITPGGETNQSSEQSQLISPRNK